MTATAVRPRDGQRRRPPSSAKSLEHRYAPRGVCRDLFSYRGSEIVLAGPAGTGKSRACLEKLNAVALANPGMRGLMVRKTAASLTSTGLVTWREHVATQQLLNGSLEFYGGSAEEPAQFRYDNGSKIMIGGMDRAIKIMSSEYDLIYVQEATELSLADWEALTSRLRNGRVRFQQLLADCNPDTPTHWLKARADAGTTRMLDSRHQDNPTLYTDDGQLTDRGHAYMTLLDALTGVRYLRLRKGLWVAAEGLVYDEYDPAIHVIDPFPIPRDWPRYWSVDFGYTNPFVCQMWAEDPDGRLYLYREIYRTKRLVEDHARDILSTVTDQYDRWAEPKPRRVICDHDAEDRETLRRHLNLPMQSARKTVSDGIQATAARFRVQPDGKPRLYLMRDAVVHRDPELATAMRPTSTVEELPGYVWDIGSGKAPKEAPLKVNDHGCDAARYLVMDLDHGSRPSVRMLV